MADLAGRVKLMERKLNWLMDTMRMKFAIGDNSLVGSDGRPIGAKIYEGSLNEIYALQREMRTVLESDGPPVEESGDPADLVVEHLEAVK